jgi:hypothetical protein
MARLTGNCCWERHRLGRSCLRRQTVRMHRGPQRRQKGKAQNQKSSIPERGGTTHSDPASQFGDPFHDAIWAMTVVTAIPVVKANVRARITKIVFIIVSHASNVSVAQNRGGFCDGHHVSSVSRHNQKGYKIHWLASTRQSNKDCVPIEDASRVKLCSAK